MEDDAEEDDTDGDARGIDGMPGIWTVPNADGERKGMSSLRGLGLEGFEGSKRGISLGSSVIGSGGFRLAEFEV